MFAREIVSRKDLREIFALLIRKDKKDLEQIKKIIETF